MGRLPLCVAHYLILTSNNIGEGIILINPLNAVLNPICHLLALLDAHRILHVSRIRVKSFSLKPCGWKKADSYNNLNTWFVQPIHIYTYIFFSPPMPPHVLMNFRGFPPGCGNSVADFWGWDAHEARLRCPDDVSGDMQEDEIPGGTLSLNLLTTQTMVTTGIFPCKEKFPR